MLKMGFDEATCSEMGRVTRSQAASLQDVVCFPSFMLNRQWTRGLIESEVHDAVMETSSPDTPIKIVRMPIRNESNTPLTPGHPLTGPVYLTRTPA